MPQLDPRIPMVVLHHPRLVDPSSAPAAGETVYGPRVLCAAGATLIAAPEAAPGQAEAALKLLRGFRAARRRLVWLDVAELAASAHTSLAEWGRRVVHWGDAKALLVTGPRGRDLAVAARDAGLPLSQTIVCTCAMTARNLLADMIRPGDVALLLGVDAQDIEKTYERLDARRECA